MSGPQSLLLFPSQFVQVTYRTNLDDFLCTARMAAGRLIHSTGTAWRLDGWKSDRLYLRLLYGELADQLSLIPYLDEEFDLTVGASTVTIGIHTRLATTAALFDQFIGHLDQLLPRSTP